MKYKAASKLQNKCWKPAGLWIKSSDSGHLAVSPSQILLASGSKSIHIFQALNPWLCSTTCVSILPVQLFPMVELAVCADCLWLQCTLLFCFVFVPNFLPSLLSLGYGSMPVWTVVSLVALCFQLSSAVLGKLQSAFLESTIYRSDFVS